MRLALLNLARLLGWLYADLELKGQDAFRGQPLLSPELACARGREPGYSVVPCWLQVTSLFQSTKAPFGLSFHAHTCSSKKVFRP
jgi:hypothetical protein